MRLLVAAALLGAMVAGCLSEETPDVPGVVAGVLPPGAPDFGNVTFPWQSSQWYHEFEGYDLTGSHPAYSFPVESALPLVGEPGPGLPEDWRRPRPADLPDVLSSLVFEGNVPGVESGSGIALFGPYAYAASWQTPDMWVTDISEPGLPKMVGHTQNSTSGDFDVVAFPDGQLVLVGSTRGQDIILYDVTDPTDPRFLGGFQTANGNHNHVTVPGTPLVYNTGSGGGPGGKTDIWDISDPTSPRLVNDWENGYECHAASFLIDRSQDLYRGYCAGIGMVQIWDITDPVNPTVINEFPYPRLAGDQAAPASFAHLAMPNHDGTVLIVGDETGGGAAPGCDVYVEAPTGQTVSGPYGNLWFYDISDEENEVLHGRYSPAAWEQRGSCTAHFGDVIEDTNHILMAFYTAGVALVDFTDLDNPRAVDLWQRDSGEGPELNCDPPYCGVWDVQYYQGYIFTGDFNRGMDILTLA